MPQFSFFSSLTFDEIKSISTFIVVHLSSFTATPGHRSWQVCFHQQPEKNDFEVRKDDLTSQNQQHHRPEKLTCLLQCLHIQTSQDH